MNVPKFKMALLALVCLVYACTTSQTIVRKDIGLLNAKKERKAYFNALNKYSPKAKKYWIQSDHVGEFYGLEGFTQVAQEDKANVTAYPQFVFTLDSISIRNYRAGDDLALLLTLNTEKCEYMILNKGKFITTVLADLKNGVVNRTVNSGASVTPYANTLNEYLWNKDFQIIVIERILGAKIHFRGRGIVQDGKIQVILRDGKLTPLGDLVLMEQKRYMNIK